MNVSTQYTLFRTMTGEPSDSANQRFTQALWLPLINEARRYVAEKTRSFEMRDSQTTNPSNVATKFYTLPNDIIGFYDVEYDGEPLEPVRSEDWRDRVGDDDDMQGTPWAFKHHARILQLFYVPDEQKTLRYHGWGYPQDLLENGVDTDYTDQQARAAVFQSVILAKMADEREVQREIDLLNSIIRELASQHRRRGPRFVRSAAARRLEG